MRNPLPTLWVAALLTVTPAYTQPMEPPPPDETPPPQAPPQSPDDRPPFSNANRPPRPQRGNHGEDHPGKGRRIIRRPQRTAPLERYLERLAERDPEEYERLIRLKKEDPEAFQKTLREKVMRRRSHGRHRGHPFADEIRSVQNADTPEARKKATEALKERIGDLVDRNLERRERRIEQIRKELKRLEDLNEQERVRRDEIIEHHLERLLEMELPDPGAPPVGDTPNEAPPSPPEPETDAAP